MSDDELKTMLRELDDYARSKRITRMALSRDLGVPYSTFKKWFFSEDKGRKPAPQHLVLVRGFLDSKRRARAEDEALWSRILGWWETQHRYRTVRALADEIGWDDSLLDHFQSKKVPPHLVVRRIAETAGLVQVRSGADAADVQRRVQRLRWLLLLLEDDLGWFRDATQAERRAVREELDQQDVGYIASLMTMLGDEERFQRWLSLTTNRFNFLKRRGGEK